MGYNQLIIKRLKQQIKQQKCCFFLWVLQNPLYIYTVINNNMHTTPRLIEAINCFRTASVLDLYGPGDELDARWHHAYSEECRLFSEFFVNFTKQEHDTYKAVAQWLNETALTHCDLTTAELLEVFFEKNSNTTLA
jgi:hypothetical protein